MSKGNEVTVTNDGATILKSIYIDNPAAKVLVGESCVWSFAHACNITLTLEHHQRQLDVSSAAPTVIAAAYCSRLCGHTM
jgi:hypothetical protein